MSPSPIDPRAAGTLGPVLIGSQVPAGISVVGGPWGLGPIYGQAGNAASAAGAGSALPIIGVILIASSLVYSIATRPNGKDRRQPGVGFQLGENPTDPNEPIGLGYGMPTIVPPILCRYLKRGGLNSLAYLADAGDVFVSVLSLGGGPIDGRDLQVWMNDEPVFEKTASDAPVDETNLEQVDADGKRWRFPKRDVTVDSVVLYRDDALIGANTSGGGIDDTVETTISDGKAAVRLFRGDEPARDGLPVQTGDTRYGAYLPIDTTMEAVRDLSVDLVPKAGRQVRLSPRVSGSFASGLFASLVNSRTTLPSSHVHLSTTPEGKTFVWVGVDTTGQFSGDGIDHLRVSFRTKPRIRIVLEPDGQAYAEFETSQTGHVISATYSTSRFTDANGKALVELVLRTGEADQEPLPTEDGIRNTSYVGAELGQGDAAAYESVNEVHDIEVGIASGAEGFVDVAKAGTNAGDTRPATRRLQIRLKHRDAPATDTAGTNLLDGWVLLKHPTRQDNTFPVTGVVNGPARWTLSAAELYAFTRDGKESPGFSLPLAKYDVEVRALDVPGNRDDNRTHATIQSRIFFDDATEIVRIRLVLPYHATLTVKVREPKLLGSTPVFAVRCGMRRVVVPGEEAEVMDLGDGLKPWERIGGALVPSPRRWTRNNAWCAVDIITDPWFGAGQWYDWTRILLEGDAGAREAGEWCDSTEPGETMAELDLWIPRRSAVLDHVAQMFAGARVLPVLSGSLWEFPIDRDEDPVLDLTDDDLEREATPAHASTEELPTVIEAAFLDEALGGELAPHTVALPAQDPRRRVLRRVDMTGVRRRSQLDRVLKVALSQFLLQRDALSARAANWRMLRLRAGRIVRVTSSEAGWEEQLCRVISVVWGSNLKAAVHLVLHDPDSYTLQQFKGPSGGVTPASRPPSDTVTTPEPEKDGGGTESAPAVSSSGGSISFFVQTQIVLKKFLAKKVTSAS